MGIGDVYVSAQLVSKAGRPNEVVPISVAKYLVIFADGRQAVITSRLAESQLNLERFLF